MESRGGKGGRKGVEMQRVGRGEKKKRENFARRLELMMYLLVIVYIIRRGKDAQLPHYCHSLLLDISASIWCENTRAPLG